MVVPYLWKPFAFEEKRLLSSDRPVHRHVFLRDEFLRHEEFSVDVGTQPPESGLQYLSLNGGSLGDPLKTMKCEDRAWALEAHQVEAEVLRGQGYLIGIGESHFDRAGVAWSRGIAAIAYRAKVLDVTAA